MSSSHGAAGSSGVAISFSSSRRSATAQTSASSLLETMKELQDNFPRLIVFDLDNTLWTPELYELYSKPVPNKDIHLFPDALQVLKCLYEFQTWRTSRNSSDDDDAEMTHFELAIASRTHQYEWAHSLLDTIPVTEDGVNMRNLFPHVQIQTGSKRQHFERLKATTGIPYSQMLFLDDDEYLNLGEVSSMGVLSCHTPRGVTLNLMERSLRKYAELRNNSQEAEAWMGHILNAKILGIQQNKERWR